MDVASCNHPIIANIEFLALIKVSNFFVCTAKPPYQDSLDNVLCDQVKRSAHL